MLEVADKKDRSRSTNGVDDGDNLAAFRRGLSGEVTWISRITKEF